MCVHTCVRVVILVLQASLRQLLRRLQKEHAEAEWQLRDCEWRLDQEGAVSPNTTLHMQPHFFRDIRLVSTPSPTSGSRNPFHPQSVHRAAEEKSSIQTALEQVSQFIDTLN